MGSSSIALRDDAASRVSLSFSESLRAMPKPFYITTAIDYTNGAPHIGHAYEKVLADVIARYHRLKGDEVFFLTGVDQHGQKVQQSAEKAGVSPQQFVDEITAKFIALWEKLDVRYDGWAETTDPLHKNACRECSSGSTTKSKSTKTNRRASTASGRNNFSPTRNAARRRVRPGVGRGRAARRRELYFKLTEHKDWLLDFLRAHPDCVTPDFRRTELLNAVEKLSGDLCISRPKSRLSWGIELPFDRDYVNYVWFDALTNYISFVGSIRLIKLQTSTRNFQEKWPALHVIGKDILIPAHGIYWPIMLHALGFPDEQMPVPRPRLVEHLRSEDEQIARQRCRSRRTRGQIRRGSAAVLFDERYRDGKMRTFRKNAWLLVRDRSRELFW